MQEKKLLNIAKGLSLGIFEWTEKVYFSFYTYRYVHCTAYKL
jgi:hypothetical protein